MVSLKDIILAINCRIETAETVQQPQPQPQPQPEQYQPREVDDSVVWHTDPSDYQIEQLDQYEKPYLIKIIIYLDKHVKLLNDRDISRRKTLINQQDEITQLRIQLNRKGVTTTAAQV